jgi:hypothetical protein
LHLRIVIAHPSVRSLARFTLTNFALLLAVALFMVIPEPAPAAGAQLVGAGVVSLIVNAPSLTAVARSNEWTTFFGRLLLRLGLSTLSYLGIIAAGVQFLGGFGAPSTWLAIGTVVLLLISLRNTWDLLVTLGEVALASGPNDD